MPDQDPLLLTGGPVIISATGRPPTVTITAYSGGLMTVPDWGPLVIDLTGLDLSALQVDILAEHNSTHKGIVDRWDANSRGATDLDARRLTARTVGNRTRGGAA